jgi:glutamate 5-kinase
MDYKSETAKRLFHEALPDVKSLVIKIGSRILSSDVSGGASDRVVNLVRDIAGLKKRGIRVVLVSSGAIAHGVLALNLPKRPTAIPMQQACAGIGQIRLMHMYETLFQREGVLIGQVLVTWDDLREKKRYLNLRNTLFQLLSCNAIPIINENDSVGVEEIKFGDNDTLGAQIAMLVNADLYVNLSDIGGLFDANPKKNRAARHIPLVSAITPQIKALAERDGTAQGVGGMETKLKAAEMLNHAGIHTVIGDGYHHRLGEVLADNTVCTLFLASAKKMSLKNRWIAFAGRRCGLLLVDNGARTALVEKNKSLLPAGVISIEGNFKVGDMVEIAGDDRKPFAAGMVNYDTVELEKIKGKKTVEISNLLGSKSFDEVVHRDNLVIV